MWFRTKVGPSNSFFFLHLQWKRSDIARMCSNDDRRKAKRYSGLPFSAICVGCRVACVIFGRKVNNNKKHIHPFEVTYVNGNLLLTIYDVPLFFISVTETQCGWQLLIYIYVTYKVNHLQYKVLKFRMQRIEMCSVFCVQSTWLKYKL